MAEVIVKRGGMLDKFLASRTKIQLLGGGFGNGKTTGAVTKALQLGIDAYPGMNALMARETYPKLNDTLRAEFLKWCPKDLIQSFPLSVNSSNTCTLKNGTRYNFRYIQQQGKAEESSTSNLLSATYDLVVVDQIEDPGIGYKDLLDLLGRLRGNTIYRGDDPTMPRVGPQWVILTTNPTRNWVWKKIVEPLYRWHGHGKPGDDDYYPGGEFVDDLMCLRDGKTELPILDEQGQPYLLVELFEAPTHENKHNLSSSFIQTMESMYRGQQKKRYLLGKWGAYEGLVYPQFDEQVHYVDENYIKQYLAHCIKEGYEIEWLEGYDYGQAAPSCYLLSFIDPNGYVIVVDGFYEKEYDLDLQGPHIKRIRRKWGAEFSEIIETHVLGDPAIFRRPQGKGSVIADIFREDHGISMQRGQNDLKSGIAKVQGYLNVIPGRLNPFTLSEPSPSIFFNSGLPFIGDEMGAWFWKKNKSGEREDEPQEGNDHALDTLRYKLTYRPLASQLKPSAKKGIPDFMKWMEPPDEIETLGSRRHG